MLGIQFGELHIGITITVGAMLASPSDISGSIKRKISGILFATILAMLISLVGGYLHQLPWLVFPVLGILMFAISYISIYGFRASLISFSGLFALVLSFSEVSVEMEPFERMIYIGIGGCWYATLVLLRHFIFPKAPTEYYLSKTLKLTASYLKLRGELVTKSSERSELMKKLLNTQTELTETHETLRDILIARRKGSGKSNYGGKRLLIFVQLVDMLELAMANPVDYSKTDAFFEKKPTQMENFQTLLFAMSDRLHRISDNMSTPKKIRENSEIEVILKKIERDIEESASTSNEIFDENLLLLKNLFKYQKEQIRKIEKIEWLLQNPTQREISSIKREDSHRFLTKQKYDLDIFTENLNLRSPIFKHSLRLAVMTMIGYYVGILFSVQNPYWILLTLIVIMRPSYGLTKKRSKERTIGTLIGGVLAAGIVLLTQNTTVYGILAITSLVVAFSMVQRNYKAGATFVTLSVVFIYALLRPDIFNVIQFRVMDTLIGAGLATVGNLLLWPAWEISGMQKTLLKTIGANKNYLNEIIHYYNKKGAIPSAYKVARKEAFLEISNLNAAFQRMTQEPKSKQKSLDKIYETVVLNHTFLSSLASLSTYILNNPTTPASENFNAVSANIVRNLSEAETILKAVIETDPKASSSKKSSINTDSEGIFDATFGKNISLSEEEKKLKTESFHSKIEEAHLVREQLKWLLAMSAKIPKLLKGIAF